MTVLASSFAARLAGALGSATSPVTLLTGHCGTGRTSVLLGVHRLVGDRACQYVDVERIATTPERFLTALVGNSPFQAVASAVAPRVRGPREAFDASLAFLSSACTAEGRPATFLLDEVLDLRTFESFPGLRSAVPELVTALESSPNRFVLATRFSCRAARLARRASGHVELRALPEMTVEDVCAEIDALRIQGRPADDELARTVHALTDGRAFYVRAMVDAMATMAGRGGADPIGALVALLSSGGALWARCRFCYELRLHRARGYGALKAILDVLAEEEPLTLTAISQRLARTPGSTKDYLGWLEDVDLIAADRKRYRIGDPLLRLWIRLHSRPSPAPEETIVGEVQRYAMIRLAAAARTAPGRPTPPAASADAVPRTEAAAPVAVAAATTPPDTAGWSPRSRASGIVEFD
jgi:hypothetical protein